MPITPAALGALARGDLDNFMVAATPGGIERQQKAGQAALVNSTYMPKEMSPNREMFEALGFKFGESVDDLFLNADMPPGWKRAATDHSMHSDIIDEKGRRRVGVFYKAAFYDRRANAHLVWRYTVDSYDEIRPGVCVVRVLDAGVEIQRFGEYTRHDYKAAKPLKDAARAWLDAYRPGHGDLLAAWSGP
jgi:hypothetical protein